MKVDLRHPHQEVQVERSYRHQTVFRRKTIPQQSGRSVPRQPSVWFLMIEITRVAEADQENTDTSDILKEKATGTSLAVHSRSSSPRATAAFEETTANFLCRAASGKAAVAKISACLDVASVSPLGSVAICGSASFCPPNRCEHKRDVLGWLQRCCRFHRSRVASPEVFHIDGIDQRPCRRRLPSLFCT